MKYTGGETHIKKLIQQLVFSVCFSASLREERHYVMFMSSETTNRMPIWAKLDQIEGFVFYFAVNFDGTALKIFEAPCRSWVSVELIGRNQDAKLSSY